MNANDVGYGTSWLRSCKKEVSENGSRVAELVNGWLRGIYHAQADVLRADWTGDHVEILHHGHGLASFDFSSLTRLVIGAHDAAIRVEISPCTPKLIRFRFHPRKRDGNGSPWMHPTIEGAIERLGVDRLPIYADPLDSDASWARRAVAAGSGR